MIAHSTRPSPAIESSEPTTSGRSGAGFLESDTNASANANPAAAIGTLIRNTDPHAKSASSSPPTIGPSAIPAPLVAAQNPIARWRSWRSVKVLVMIASVEGMINAAPIPMLARAAISISTEPEKAAHVEHAANATRPARKVRLRPIRSARLPATSIRHAKTST